ncbi:MAG: hypothetical protein IJ849_04470 [Selenomonadaceae bacterium]|nr:hypothetical protein [Selenomonadaceae bacterium]
MPTIGDTIKAMNQVVDYVAIREPRLAPTPNEHPALNPTRETPEKAAGVNYSAYSALQSSVEMPQSVTEAIGEYTAQRDDFQDRLQEAMEEAQNTSAGLKEMRYEDEGDDTVERMQEIAAENSRQAAAAREAAQEQRSQEIKNLLNGYNSAVNSLNEQRGTSALFDRFADTFEGSGDLVDSLGSIGIDADITGELRVDDERLDTALRDRPKEVESTLSENGLAGRIDRHVSLSKQRAEALFPKVDSLLGQSSDNHKGMYSEDSVVTARPSGSYGKFMDMYY